MVNHIQFRDLQISGIGIPLSESIASLGESVRVLKDFWIVLCFQDISIILYFKSLIFIPYKLLAPLSQVPPVPGTKWRVNMYRVDHDNGSSQFVWQKTNRNFHDYNSFGTFIFE